MFELTDTFYGNEIKTWLIALAVAIGTLVALRLVEQVLIVRVQRIAQKTHTVIDDVVIGALRKTKLLYLLIISVFVGSLWVTLEPGVRSVSLQTVIVATLIQGGIWVSAGLQIWLEHFR